MFEQAPFLVTSRHVDLFESSCFLFTVRTSPIKCFVSTESLQGSHVVDVEILASRSRDVGLEGLRSRDIPIGASQVVPQLGGARAEVDLSASGSFISIEELDGSRLVGVTLGAAIATDVGLEGDQITNIELGASRAAVDVPLGALREVDVTLLAEITNAEPCT